MFTGIIESLATIVDLQKEGSNLHVSCKSEIVDELKIDQSLAHNGVCLTVVKIDGDIYTVTAIKETLDKSNLGKLEIGDKVNLERSMKLGDRLDGHIVQGHVDKTAVCTQIKQEDGSWVFSFEYIKKHPSETTVEKGSITVNGTSLTVVNSMDNSFSVCIIPYTFEHTNFKQLKKGDKVNLEFDIIGKYVARMMKI